MYKSIFISDLHLGYTSTNSKKLFSFLQRVEAEKIFLVGDIINISSFSEHPDIVQFITMLHSKPWKIIYISGNHEDNRKKHPLVSLSFEKDLFPKDKHIYYNGYNNIYIDHGHSFHNKNMFHILLKKYTIYFRTRFKKEHKNRIEIKTITKHIKKDNIYHQILKPIAQKLLKNSFRSYMLSLAKQNRCDIVICGHFHIPEDRTFRDIRYINCGDWIKHNSFVVEDMSGKLSLKTLK